MARNEEPQMVMCQVCRGTCKVTVWRAAKVKNPDTGKDEIIDMPHVEDCTGCRGSGVVPQ